MLYHLETKELNINLRNNLVILIEDRYVNIIYKLLDREAMWCRFVNLTGQKIKFMQQTDNFYPILGR